MELPELQAQQHVRTAGGVQPLDEALAAEQTGQRVVPELVLTPGGLLAQPSHQVTVAQGDADGSGEGGEDLPVRPGEDRALAHPVDGGQDPTHLSVAVQRDGQSVRWAVRRVTGGPPDHLALERFRPPVPAHERSGGNHVPVRSCHRTDASARVVALREQVQLESLSLQDPSGLDQYGPLDPVVRESPPGGPGHGVEDLETVVVRYQPHLVPVDRQQDEQQAGEQG